MQPASGPDPEPDPCVAAYRTDALALYRALRRRAESDEPLRTALRVLEGAVRLYPPSRLAVAFNGGKDATVVMHLARAVLAHAAAAARPPAPALRCLYLLPAPGAPDEFPEVDAFVREQVAMCRLHAVEVAAPFKDGIAAFTAGCDAHCAFVMGTRSDDPHGAHMQHFEPSSPGWPPFMRVNPILTWDYHHVWRFLREFKLPYCPMYDRGYTSIGSVATTLPNPSLRIPAQAGAPCRYKPAWQLEDARLERAGRLQKQKPKSLNRPDDEHTQPKP